MFLHAERTGREEDVLLLTQGSGHMTLPAGVQVLVQSGYAKCEPAAFSASGSTVVGSRGIRAPPPSRASGYARSSVGSAYSAATATRSSSYRPSPPRDAASFTRGPGSSYMSACDVPLPRSEVGRRSSSGSEGDWEVVEQMSDYIARVDRLRDDACSIAPSESISSVGSRGGASSYLRRFSHY